MKRITGYYLLSISIANFAFMAIPILLAESVLEIVIGKNEGN